MIVLHPCACSITPEWEFVGGQIAACDIAYCHMVKCYLMFLSHIFVSQFEPVVNGPQAERQWVPKVSRANSYLGLVNADMINVHWYVFNQINYTSAGRTEPWSTRSLQNSSS